MLFSLHIDNMPVDRLDALKGIIERHNGAVPAFIEFMIPDRSLSTLPLSKNFNVMASDELRLEVERLFGYNAATFE